MTYKIEVKQKKFLFLSFDYCRGLSKDDFKIKFVSSEIIRSSSSSMALLIAITSPFLRYSYALEDLGCVVSLVPSVFFPSTPHRKCLVPLNVSIGGLTTR